MYLLVIEVSNRPFINIHAVLRRFVSVHSLVALDALNMANSPVYGGFRTHGPFQKEA